MNIVEEKDKEARCDVRCVCGSLVAKLVSNGVELRCRRCKRTFVVPILSDAAADGAPGEHD